jgi:predicted KAP-like P-loop ATPase
MQSVTLTHGSPIARSAEDRLGRSRFAAALAKSLFSYSDNESIVIGLFGPWGSGKSSLLNLTASELQTLAGEDGPLVLRFNPWDFAGETRLLEQYFQFLATELRERNPSTQMKKAADALEVLSVATSPLSAVPVVSLLPKALEYGSKALRKQVEQRGQLDKAKTRVSDALASQSRKIVVIMDDVDRLASDEIRKVFQLVKACGDFKNVIYVLAFDKAVVSGALTSVQGGDGNAYLEKIINVPFYIPPISQAQLHSLLRQDIENLAKGAPEYDWANDRLAEIVSTIASMFTTMRQLDRFANSLRLSEVFLKGEVDYADLLALGAIQVTSYELYEFVRDHPNLFVDHLLNLYLRGEGVDSVERESIERFFVDHPSVNAAQVLPLLKLVFPKLKRLYDGERLNNWSPVEWRRSRRLASDLLTFESYFQLDLSREDVSVAELRTVIKCASSVDSLDSRLKQFADRGLLGRLVTRLTEVDWKRETPQALLVMVQALISNGDKYRMLHKKGDIAWDIIRLIDVILCDLEGDTRYSVVHSALRSTSSLFIPMALISLEDQRHDRHLETNGGEQSNGRSSESEALFSDAQLDALEVECSNVLSRAAADSTLWAAESLVFLLARWEEWSGIEQVRKRVMQDMSSDAVFLAFVERFINKFNPKSWFSNEAPAFDWKNLSNYVDKRTLVERFKAIRVDELSAADHAALKRLEPSIIALDEAIASE